jgi:hypothetical protein
MTTAYRVDISGDDIGCEPPPFEYQLEGPYTRQLLLSVFVVIVLAALTVTVGMSLVTASA